LLDVLNQLSSNIMSRLALGCGFYSAFRLKFHPIFERYLMKLKLVMAVAMLAASFGASATAHSFRSLDPSGDQTSSGADGISKGFFEDTWSFILAVPSSTGLGAQQSFTTTAGAISGLTGELFMGTPGIVGAKDLGSFSYSQTVGGALVPVQQNLSWSGNLGAGDYYIDITGVASINKTAYSTTLSITPVPEPETYGMLLVGLGLLGFTASRKSNPKLG